jgi:hypothetical protein
METLPYKETLPYRERYSHVETLPQDVMQTQANEGDMGRRRALLTDRERELIADEDEEDQRYVAISRVRTKIHDELPEDIELLQEHHPDLYEELREIVCEEGQDD